jgi:rhodanese-related sulfurtransferase
MSVTVKDLMSAARAAVPSVTPTAASELAISGDALILDVRDGTEVAASGKIKGAVAISRGMLEFRADPAVPTHDPALRKDRPILLYCASGGRAALAGKTLIDMGFKDVRNLGGFKELVDAGWPVERS